MMNIFKQIQKAFAKKTSNSDRHQDEIMAVKRAYANFARTYPDWTAAYFDECFLIRQMASLLKRYPRMSQGSMALILATEWSRQFRWADQFKRRRLVNEAAAIANDFLRLLDAESSGQVVKLSPFAQGV